MSRRVTLVQLGLKLGSIHAEHFVGCGIQGGGKATQRRREGSVVRGVSTFQVDV